MAVGWALRDLPVIRAGFRAGRLSYAKARALTRIATVENEAGLADPHEEDDGVSAGTTTNTRPPDNPARDALTHLGSCPVSTPIKSNRLQSTTSNGVEA